MSKNNLKVSVLIKGGLGNQLFCYAAARSLAIRNSAELIIDNISSFKRDFKYRQSYQLHHFNTIGRLANYYERLEPFGRVRRKLLRKLNSQKSLEQRAYITDEESNYFSEFLNLKINHSVILDGYWQDEKYFIDNKRIIQKELTVIPPNDIKNQDYAHSINKNSSVAVHVRWFEKNSEAAVNTIKKEYYNKAIEYYEDHLNEPHYFLFSDDIASAIRNISFPHGRLIPVDFNSSDQNAYADFWLMSQCNHFIIANSTFSWWAAWLGEKNDSIILYPGKKYQNSDNWNFIDIVPDRWQKIN